MDTHMQGFHGSNDEDTPAQRLRAARIAAGFRSGSSFARDIGVNVTTYLCHESGMRPLNTEIEKTYATRLKLRPGTLLYGSRLPSDNSLPIVGSIGEAPIKADKMPDSAVHADFLDINLAGLVAHRIVGDSSFPAYRDGDSVLHFPLDTERYNPWAIHGEECIVLYEDGSVALRQVTVQHDGLCTLIAYHAAPQFDVRLLAASPVQFVVRSKIRPRR